MTRTKLAFTVLLSVLPLGVYAGDQSRPGGSVESAGAAAAEDAEVAVAGARVGLAEPLPPAEAVAPGAVAPPEAAGAAATPTPASPRAAADMGCCRCPAADSTLLCKPLGKMPMSIKDTGLFPMPPDLSKHSDRLIEYVPDPPLWSDGMEKQRFMLLPMGAKVDNTDRMKWTFPIGDPVHQDTSSTTAARAASSGRSRPASSARAWRRRTSTSSTSGTPTNTDATLVVNDIEGDPNKDENVMITIKHIGYDGKPLMVNNGAPFLHTLPSRNACGECHDENGKVAQTFIGFDEMRLNSKFNATATRTQLQDLDAKGIFTKAMPATPVDHHRQHERRRAPAAHQALRVRQLRALPQRRRPGRLPPRQVVEEWVNKEVPETQSVKPYPGMLRVFGKDPTKSVVYLQVQRTMLPPPIMSTGEDIRLRPMPPVGVADVAVDQTALADIRAWIMSLPVPPR